MTITFSLRIQALTFSWKDFNNFFVSFQDGFFQTITLYNDDNKKYQMKNNHNANYVIYHSDLHHGVNSFRNQSFFYYDNHNVRLRRVTRLKQSLE